MNKVVFIGNLTRAPEMSKTEKGIIYTRFSIAINRDYKDENGNKVTDFMPVIAWRSLAELSAKYLDKGRKVCVIGQLHTRSYEKDGIKFNTFDIVADEIEFLTPQQKSTNGETPELEKVEVDDMPF